MNSLIEKENSIFDILQKFIYEKLEFVVVGGYAVSSFKHRFSVDADIVIKKSDLEKFENILLKQGFKKTINKELENVYASQFVRYEKNTASIDLLIDALACRQTGASFSYDLVFNHSSKRKIIGIEKEIDVLIPEREILIVVKIHSGRLTDFRDVAALAKDSDLSLIKKYLFRGNKKEILKNLKRLDDIVNDQKFVDSFKGVFMEKKFDIDFKKVKEISKLDEKINN